MALGSTITFNLCQRYLGVCRWPPLLDCSATLAGARKRCSRMFGPSAGLQSDTLQVLIVPIASIRKDGQTQHRDAIDPKTVAKYTDLMRDGVVFPPVRVWWDGTAYWLADGFHRIAATERAGHAEIIAEIRSGSVGDAQWDSFSANACHGRRWSGAESERVIQLALAHPNAGRLSNVELARHLHVSEKTVRRWRKTLSSAHAEDKIRLVTRGQAKYTLATDRIGRATRVRRPKSRKEIQAELASMKEHGSPKIRPLLNIIGNWAFGSAAVEECLAAMERVIGG